MKMRKYNNMNCKNEDPMKSLSEFESELSYNKNGKEEYSRINI